MDLDSTPHAPKSPSLVTTIAVSTLIATLAAGVGVYAYQKKQNDSKVANLQSQIDTLTKLALAKTTPTPVLQPYVQTSVAPTQPTTSKPTDIPAADQSITTVSDFYTTYEALSKDTQNLTLKHKLLIDLFSKPTSPQDADMQSRLYSGKSVNGTPGGPELFGSASGADQLLSYKIISHTVSSRTGADQEATYYIDETVFNGSQGNTKQAIRHQVLRLIRSDPNSPYLISSYTSSDPGANQGAFYGFIE